MNTPGPMTRFTTHFKRVRPFGPQGGVRGHFEWLGHGLVTFGATVRAHELCACDLRRDDPNLFGRHARNQDERSQDTRRGQDQLFPKGFGERTAAV